MRNICGWMTALLMASSLTFSGGCEGKPGREADVPLPLLSPGEVPYADRGAVRSLKHRIWSDSQTEQRTGQTGSLYLSFSPDSKLLVTHDGTILRAWDVETLQERFHVPVCSYERWRSMIPCWDELPSRSIWISPDSRFFVSALDRKTLCFRDTATGRIIHKCPPFPEKVYGVQGPVLSDKRMLLADLKSKCIIVSLDDLARDNRPLPYIDLPHFEKEIIPGLLHPGGRKMASAYDKSIRDLATGVKLHTFPDGHGVIRYYKFSDDGRFLGICYKYFAFSADWDVKLVRVDQGSGQQVWSLRDTTNNPIAQEIFSFSPDGMIFATADSVFVTLRELLTGQEILRFKQGDLSVEYSKRTSVESIAFLPDNTRLAVAWGGDNVSFWPLKPPGLSNLPLPLGPTTLKALWERLGTPDDAPNAYRAIWILAASPEAVVPFLAERLTPIPKFPTARIRQLIADLDDDSFHRREAATRELSTADIQAEPFLRQCLLKTSSPEVRRRVKLLLETLNPPKTWIVTDASLLRSLRAIRVLQCIGTPEARAFLEKLAAGAPVVRQTQEAKAALQFLDQTKKR
jgi:WD40 repeat protein